MDFQSGLGNAIAVEDEYVLMMMNKQQQGHSKMEDANFSFDETQARFTHLCKIFLDNKGALTNMSAIGSIMVVYYIPVCLAC
ncbi:hypothetical protein V2J09_016677 [Rumex salicifolius]